MEKLGAKEQAQRIESLVRRAEGLPNAAARAVVLELVQAVLEYHAAGLERIVELTREAGEPGRALMAAIAADELAGSLLLLHDLHPDSISTRVVRALENLAPFLRRRQASARLVSIDGGTVRVKAEAGSGPAEAVQAAVEEAVRGMAPDAEDVIVEIEGPSTAGFVPLSSLVAG